MALSQKEIEVLINELETRLERLRHLYDQYFLGFEKLAPEVPRKDVERRIAELRRDQIRNTALRFRFQVITQKYQTYQSFWQRVCRQIEEGTFKRHLQRAKARFGVNGKRGRLDLELDIDVDLGELESEVEEDMKAADDGLSDEDRRILREVEAEMRGENASPDTERPDRPGAASDRAAAASQRTPPVTAPAASYANEDDDDGDDLPTNRPPASVTAERLALSVPKNPVPSFSGEPAGPERGSERMATAPVFAPGTSRPVIRKSIDAPGRALTGVPGAPQIRRASTVMPLVAAAPQKSSAPSAQPQSAGRIALPAPGSMASIAGAGAGTSSRKPPENMPSPESGSMRAAPEKSAIRSSPQGAQAQEQSGEARVAGLGAPGRASAHMRAGAPVTPVASGAPAATSGASATNVPPSSAKSAAPSKGGAGRNSATHSKPPPPLPSAVSTRGRTPSLADLADAAKKGEKEPKK